jgi:hypothetical protein
VVTHNFRAAYLQNPWLRWLWGHGWEEPVGPGGPLVSERFGPQPEPWRSAVTGPSPEPWRIAVAQLVQAAQARDLAAKLPEGRLKSELTRSSGTAIEAIIDEWCGTPPRKHPWPWPGPPPWVWEIVSEISLVANSLQPGSLRDTIEDIATQALQKTGTTG